jgi:DNA repair exonuclease SbcCD ATPase subunit
MPPKKTSSGLGAALQPLDVNQDTLREAQTQKRKATSPTPQEEELDQEIRDLEAIHQQVERKREKMLSLSDIQKKIDEAAEEIRHLTQDDQDRRPPQKELRQDNSYNDDDWYDDSIMETLLLMMLLLYQQNCRLPHGPLIQATSAPHV